VLGVTLLKLCINFFSDATHSNGVSVKIDDKAKLLKIILFPEPFLIDRPSPVGTS
jgi:hypothetical protein